MSTPEKIWACDSHIWYSDDQSEPEEYTEYTLTDLIPALLAQARAEGREDGIREAASVITGRWASTSAELEQYVLALLDTPTPAKPTVQEAQRYIHDLIISRMLPAKEGNAAISALERIRNE